MVSSGGQPFKFSAVYADENLPAAESALGALGRFGKLSDYVLDHPQETLAAFEAYREDQAGGRQGLLATMRSHFNEAAAEAAADYVLGLGCDLWIAEQRAAQALEREGGATEEELAEEADVFFKAIFVPYRFPQATHSAARRIVAAYGPDALEAYDRLLAVRNGGSYP